MARGPSVPGTIEIATMSVAAEIFLSKQIALVTRCGAADIAAEFPSRANWIDALVLRVTLHATPPADRVPFALQVVRRVETAIDEYATARTHLSNFVANGRKTSSYFRALNHFELAIAEMCKPREYLVNYPGKGSIPEDELLRRIQGIHDTVKHQPALADQTVWITDDGLQSKKHPIRFAEIEEALRSLGNLAVEIAVPS